MTQIGMRALPNASVIADKQALAYSNLKTSATTCHNPLCSRLSSTLPAAESFGILDHVQTLKSVVPVEVLVE